MDIIEEINELTPTTINMDANQIIETLEWFIIHCDEELVEENERLLNDLKSYIRDKKINQIFYDSI
jgi:hypothetical protein